MRELKAMCLSVGLALLPQSVFAQELTTVVFDFEAELETEIVSTLVGQTEQTNGSLGGSEKPEGTMISIEMLESFASASPATTPYGTAPEIDETRDIPFGIIGEDDRKLVTPTNDFPARAVVHIIFKVGQKSKSYCSGALISKNTVLTAGHCVYNAGWHSDFTIYPGRNGPLRHYDSCGVKKALTLKGWTDKKSGDYDMAALKLDCEIGATTGFFGVATTPNKAGQAVTVQGYPGEAKLRGLQYQSVDELRDVAPLKIDHEADTTGGMSGSPVYIDGPTIIAIHASTTKAPGYNQDNQVGIENHATRITPERLEMIRNWIEM